MNRLIKDLENAALDWASHEFENNGKGGIAEFNRLFTGKYAELIIEECVNIVASRPYIDDGKWNHPSIMIKRHFGVDND